MKITVEVGPIPYAERYRLLKELEKRGVSFQQSGKQEGKKHTRIYTAWTDVGDWASKQEVLKSMFVLYDAPELNDLFRKIAESVEAMADEEEAVLLEKEVVSYKRERATFSPQAFRQFCEAQGIDEDEHKYHFRSPSFILPSFSRLKERFGETRIKWWWQNGPFLIWFEQLRDGRLKLVLELGPLYGDKRVALIDELEACGLEFKPASKQKTAKYTRLFTNTKVIDDWQDDSRVADMMTRLYEETKLQDVLQIIEMISLEKSSIQEETKWR